MRPFRTEHRGKGKENASDYVVAAQPSLSFDRVSDVIQEEDNEATYWDGMNVINKESNCGTSLIQVNALLLAHEVVVELDKKQSLILDCRE
jgi:hypothetical protein